MTATLSAGGIAVPAGLGGPACLVLLDPLADEERREPQRGEHRPDEEHDRHEEAQADRTDLDRVSDEVRLRAPERACNQKAQRGEAESERQRERRVDVLDGDHDGHCQCEDDRLEGQHRGTHTPHARSPPNSTRASPTVMTDPVTSTPPLPIASSLPSAESAMPTARSIASSSRGTRMTRSAPKMSSAISASSSAGIDRGVLFCVHTISAMTGSNVRSISSTSLSAMTPTTPISGLNVNA